jgi:hypothetical protein
VQEPEDLLAHPGQVGAQLHQYLRRHPVALADQAEQDVLGAGPVVIEHPGFFFGQDNHPPRPVGKPLQHRLPPRATEPNLTACPQPGRTRAARASQ